MLQVEVADMALVTAQKPDEKLADGGPALPEV